MGALAAAARLGIQVYRLFVSPVLPKVCRFEPSCSAYALEAIGRHGLVRGGWLSVRRIARCHPWGDTGFDPVPEAGDHRTPAATAGDSPPDPVVGRALR